ncbi:MAG: cytochrome c biogenesis protein CcsA [Gammaproteobacteria bacterium]|nr:cytochrome c biogenesis protein CcsA [Gammaproteobacteria bacterium]NNC98336.1 cytochrome c biogenesis protein CcsA [Gammaproteobacteria bacterium]NNM14405.1 cytochrome c biogenesis protein CcsA [Gammaproteobacteria bacterium]
MILLGFAAFGTAKGLRNSQNTGKSQPGVMVNASAILASFLYLVICALTILPALNSADTGLSLSLGGAVALIGLVYLGLGLWYFCEQQLRGLSVMLFVLAMLCCLGLLYTDSSYLIDRQGWALYLHLGLSLAAYAFISFAALLTIIEPWQSARLRKRPGVATYYIPPLESLDSQTFKLIGSGFVLLSMALLTGFFFLENMLSQHLNHKVVLSILSWLVFAILLLGRWRLGWRGKTAMRLALLGFGLLLLAYFGSKWVLEVLLQRSWS